MFSRKERVSRIDFQKLLRSGKVIRGAYLTAHYSPSLSPKIGIIVPKKKNKKASLRNRIKRVIAGAYRDQGQHEPYFSIILRINTSIENERLLRNDTFAVLGKIYAH